MASNKPGKKEMKALIDQFCAVSGADKEVAKRMLEACAWNVDMAVGLHLDGGGASENPSPSGSQCGPNPDENVRAPIPQKQEVLVDTIAYQPIRRRTARSVFDGFRDFQAEARQQERMSAEGAPGSSKLRTLEDLFRPPIDIMFKGSFHAARDAGAARNRWLIVNIQNTKEFSCQILNRDVWSHSAVKDIIKEHFIFWQVYQDSEEGRKYMQFYKINTWPYIAVLDPRTGENLVIWSKVDNISFCDLVTGFLAEKPSPDGTSPTAEKPPEDKRRKSVIDASEDSQLEHAIKASLLKSPKNTKSASDTDSDDLETFTDSDSDSIPAAPIKKSSAALLASLSSTSPAASTSQQGHKRKLEETSSPLDTQREMEKCKSLKVSNNGISHSSLSNCDDNSSSDHDNESSADNTDSPIKNDNKDNSSVTNGKEDNSAIERLHWQHYLGPDTDPVTMLMFRFPDGKKQQLSLPCTSRLQAVLQYVVEQGYSLERYELVTNYPRRQVSHLDADKTLKDHAIFPQETIFVQAR